MVDKDIFKVSSLRIRVTSSPASEVLDLLDNTVLGNRGGMQYSLTGVRERIKAYNEELRFVSIYRHDQIMGTMGVCCRKTAIEGRQYGTAYLRYMAVHNLYQSSDEGNLTEKFSKKRKKGSLLKEKLVDVFRNPSLLDAPGCENNGQYVLYAFVESKNERSKNIVRQSGFDHLRSFVTVGFSRFNPKSDSKISRLKENEQEELKQILNKAYERHSFYSIDNLFTEGRYYIKRDKGEIVAGVNALPSRYKVVSIPGIGGWLIKAFLYKLPVFNRLFTKKDFRFLVFDTIYIKDGYGGELNALLETALAGEGYNTALIMIDEDGPVRKAIRENLKLGTLGGLLNLKPNYVYGRFVNVPDEEKIKFYNAPVYMSGIDFT